MARSQYESILDRFSLSSGSMQQWRLPDRLNEISGLAVTPDGRLLAIDDEIAVVYELDFEQGRVVKAFALGEPVIKGDFEGIAFADGLVFLTTSDGQLYVAAEGANGERVAFEMYDTMLGDQCEIEGLVQGQDNTRLFFLCKKPQENSGAGGLMLFAWHIERKELLPDESIVLPERQILMSLKIDRINPSGITIDRESGHRLIVASRQHALVEFNERGEFVSARNLRLTKRHRQSEGIELTPDGDLLIADEGGTHRARLAVYRPRDESKYDDE